MNYMNHQSKKNPIYLFIPLLFHETFFFSNIYISKLFDN